MDATTTATLRLYFDGKWESTDVLPLAPPLSDLMQRFAAIRDRRVPHIEEIDASGAPGSWRVQLAFSDGGEPYDFTGDVEMVLGFFAWSDEQWATFVGEPQ